MPLTKTWEREFAVERMREHPEVSYRSFARVLGVSHATISRWAAEAGLPPRETNAERKLRRERALARRSRRFLRSRPVPDEEVVQKRLAPDEEVEEEFEDGHEDGHEHSETVDGSPSEPGDDEDEEFEEEYEDDDEDDSSPTPILALALEAWAGRQTTKTAGPRSGTSSQPNRRTVGPPISGASAPVGPRDGRTRLGAITAELDALRPRGRAAVALLVEAVPYLRGGVSALRSYGETRGCDPADVADAERMIASRHAGSSA